tara:strand:+ start:732 stop:983 length:252 start_codon:yes stop_codon:yes gene_type:complete
MKKVKIAKKGIKPFEVELKEITMDERIEINDMIFDSDLPKNFSFFVKLIEIGTELSKDDLHKFSNDEIYAIADEVIASANKKK